MGKVRKTALLKSLARTWGEWEGVEITDKMRTDFPLLAHCAKLWKNNRYEVHAFEIQTPIGGVWQVTAIRHGNLEDVGWTEMQRILHDLFGPEVTAVEVYPPFETEWRTNLRMSVAWILPTDYELPFGLHLPTAWGNNG